MPQLLVFMWGILERKLTQQVDNRQSLAAHGVEHCTQLEWIVGVKLHQCVDHFRC